MIDMFFVLLVFSWLELISSKKQEDSKFVPINADHYRELADPCLLKEAKSQNSICQFHLENSKKSYKEKKINSRYS